MVDPKSLKFEPLLVRAIFDKIDSELLLNRLSILETGFYRIDTEILDAEMLTYIIDCYENAGWKVCRKKDYFNSKWYFLFEI